MGKRILWCALVVASISLGCQGQPADAPTSVLIIVLDALRADKVGAYGFERGTTPRLDAFANDPDAVVFEQHYVQSTWTKPSTATLFTGLYPFQHGVVGAHDRARGNEDWTEVTTPVLDDSFDTLAESLTAAGFRTFGVVKSHHLVPEYGFAQGFQQYFPPSEAKGDRRRVAKTVELATEGSTPYFGYVHLTAVHYPWPAKDRDETYMSEHGFAYDEAGRIEGGVDFGGPQIRHAIRKRGKTLAEPDVRFLHLVYEAELRRVDRDLFGPLIDGLVEAGRYDSTLILVTADHGEELYDHQSYAHGHAAWQELAHVPLIAKFPKGRRPEALGSRVARVTRTLDLMPAILDWLDLAPPGELPGAPILNGEFGEHALVEAKEDWAVVAGATKLVNDDGVWRLFDLTADPGERRDVAGDRPERAAALREMAADIRERAKGPRRQAPTIETELDEEAIRDLRTLGYIE